MIGFIVRIALALSSLGFNIYLFTSGHWGWGISFIFITALIIASFFRNENMILALNQMRVGNTDKAKKICGSYITPRISTAQATRLYFIFKSRNGCTRIGLREK